MRRDPSRLLHVPMDDNPEISRLLGQILARWALVEGELCRSLGHMLHGQHGAADTIIYTLGNFKARVDVVRAMAREQVPESPVKDQLVRAIERIQGLSTARNDYIHSLSLGGRDGLVQRRRKPGTKEGLRYLPVKVADLKQHMLAVEEAYTELARLNEMRPEFEAYARTSAKKRLARSPSSYSRSLRRRALASKRKRLPQA